MQRGAPAEPHDPERVRALYVEILAALMHAAQAAHGDPYAIYDAHELVADDQRQVGEGCGFSVRRRV